MRCSQLIPNQRYQLHSHHCMAQLRPPGKETPKKEKLEHSLSSQSEEQKTAKKIENFPTYLVF